MKSLIIGKMGFLGEAFYLSEKGAIGTQHLDAKLPFYFNLNSIDLYSIPINGITHAVIAAANGLMRKRELYPKETFQANVVNVLRLASFLAKKGITPVLFSSSYVFDGKLGNYLETSLRNPLNEYGRQNVCLEEKISQATHGNYLMLRLNKVFSVRRRKSFIDLIEEKLKRKETVKAAIDQMIAPLAVQDVIKSVQFLMHERQTGLFNLCSEEAISYFDLALDIAKLLNESSNRILPISIDDLDDSIQRPKHTHLCVDKIKQTGLNVSLKFQHRLREKWTNCSNLATTGLSI